MSTNTVSRPPPCNRAALPLGRARRHSSPKRSTHACGAGHAPLRAASESDATSRSPVGPQMLGALHDPRRPRASTTPPRGAAPATDHEPAPAPSSPASSSLVKRLRKRPNRRPAPKRPRLHRQSPMQAPSSPSQGLPVIRAHITAQYCYHPERGDAPSEVPVAVQHTHIKPDGHHASIPHRTANASPPQLPRPGDRQPLVHGLQFAVGSLMLSATQSAGICAREVAGDVEHRALEPAVALRPSG